jgi:hypothetical protein
MTVKQLQAELKKRDLATAGKKAELIARLEEDEAGNGSSAADAAGASDAAGEADQAATDDNEAADIAPSVKKAKAERSSDAAPLEEETQHLPLAPNVSAPAPVVTKEAASVPMADEADVAAEAPAPATAAAHLKQETAADPAATTPSSVTPPAPAAVAAAPAPATATNAADTDTNPSDTAGVSAQNGSASAEAVDGALAGVAATDAAPADAAPADAAPAPDATPTAGATAAAAAPADAVPKPDNNPSLRYASTCVRIDNLLKPYNPADLTRLLAGFGTLQETYFHPLMIFALARFASVAEAETAVRGLHGVRFPRPDREPLAVRFVQRSEMDTAVRQGGSRTTAAGNGGVDRVQALREQLQQKAKKVIVTAKYQPGAESAAQPKDELLPVEPAQGEKPYVRFEQTEAKPALYWGTSPDYGRPQ